MPKLLVTFLLTFLISLPSARPIYAQNEPKALEIVSTYKVDGAQGDIGDLIARILPDNLLKLATRDPNESLFGVLIPEDLAVALYRGGEAEKLVAQRGVYPVNVSTINGSIYPGDFITPSPLPGKGQKASSVSESILGLAIEEFTPEKGTAKDVNGSQVFTGSILVDLTGRPNYQNLGAFKEVLNLARSFGITFLGEFQTSEGASVLFRYIMAALITILCLYFAFRHFGSSILRGIEAIGRNPLAKGHIQSAIIINAIKIGRAHV